ncbi:IPT/TIG domain-containing protein [Pontibacter diazotrophicus]|nr:IPT/TIG domain-containing protein [Pontibacter diazotrophicus]
MKRRSFQFPFLLMLFSLFLLQSCEKEEEKLSPEVQTVEITMLSPTTVILKGNIVNLGRIPIRDYGFVCGFTPDVNDKSGYKISLGEDAKVGPFTSGLTGLGEPTSFDYKRVLYVRTFIKNDNESFFGELLTVSLPSYHVQSVTPYKGKPGDRITITGKFHTSDINQVEASFANITAKVVEVAPTKIVVEVPSGITSGPLQIPIVLRLSGQSFLATNSFEAIPVLKDFFPKSGAIGTILTITGDNLPLSNSSFTSSESLKVYMGGVEVRVLKADFSVPGYQLEVPENLPADVVSIYVQMNGTRTQLPGHFTVTPHTITSISPASGLPGDNFKIFGSNFIIRPTYYNENISVEVGNMPVPLELVSATELTVHVPSGFPEGDHSVVVKSKLHAVEAPQKYRVFHPSITSFSPASGHIGQEVVINGTFLPDRLHTVEFGNASTAAISTSNSLRVQVPMGINAGKVSVKVKYGNWLAESEDEFTVLAPTITSFSPNTGTAGSVVTISGTGFRPDTPYIAMKFGTAEATILSVTETTIRAEIPSGITGSVKIIMEQNGQTVISNNNFTVTN